MPRTVPPRTRRCGTATSAFSHACNGNVGDSRGSNDELIRHSIERQGAERFFGLNAGSHSHVTGVTVFSEDSLNF